MNQIFCINPKKPVLTGVLLNSEVAILTSSASMGNQWYRNGEIMQDATSNILMTKIEGIYTVRTSVDGCNSEMSDPFSVIVTGSIEKLIDVTFWPNPVNDFLKIEGVNSLVNFKVYNLEGKEVVVESRTNDGKLTLDFRSLAKGVYMIYLNNSENITFFRILRD